MTSNQSRILILSFLMLGILIHAVQANVNKSNNDSASTLDERKSKCKCSLLKNIENNISIIVAKLFVNL